MFKNRHVLAALAEDIKKYPGNWVPAYTTSLDYYSIKNEVTKVVIEGVAQKQSYDGFYKIGNLWKNRGCIVSDNVKLTVKSLSFVESLWFKSMVRKLVKDFNNRKIKRELSDLEDTRAKLLAKIHNMHNL